MKCFHRKGSKFDIEPNNSVDQAILKHMIDSQAEFIMEVADKTKAALEAFAKQFA